MPTLFDSIESQMGVFGDPFHRVFADDGEHSHDFCKMIAARVHSESDFPADCKQYSDAVSLLKRHSSGKNTENPYAGMAPGDAIDAMRAKDEGHLNGAQIKRRMTTKKNGRFY